MTHRRERRKARLRSDNLIFVDEVFLENAVTCSIRVLISRLWVQSHQAEYIQSTLEPHVASRSITKYYNHDLQD